MIFQQDQTPVIYSLYSINLIPSLLQAYFAWKKKTSVHYFITKVTFVSVFSFHFLFGTIINCKVYFDFNGEQCQKSSLGISIFFSLIVVILEVGLAFLLWNIFKMGTSIPRGFSLMFFDRSHLTLNPDQKPAEIIEVKGLKVDSSFLANEEIEEAIPLEEKKCKTLLRRKESIKFEKANVKLVDLTKNV